MPRRTLTAVALTVFVALAMSAPALAGGSLRLTASKTALRFSTKTLRVSHGRVTIRMTNPSSFMHGIAVEGHGVDKDGKIVMKGGVSSLTVKNLRKGRYTFYCPVPTHRASGMKGTLIVS